MHENAFVEAPTSTAPYIVQLLVFPSDVLPVHRLALPAAVPSMREVWISCFYVSCVLVGTRMERRKSKREKGKVEEKEAKKKRKT